MTTVQELPTVDLGDVCITGRLQADDSGHLHVHLVGTCNTDKCEHKITIGASDGNDALDPNTVKDTLQSAIDNARAHVRKILTGRAAIRSIASQLK
jgi:hypothetical protein